LETEDIIVLAASLKHGGRCIAGLSTADGRWVRPVGTGGHGELYPYHYDVDGRVPSLLDVVHFQHDGNTSEPDQPENVRVVRSPWERIERIPLEDAYARLSPALVRGPEVLGSRSHYVDEDVAARGMAASLALVEPSELCLSLDHHSSKPQGSPRAKFTHDGQHYDLPLTDFIIKPRLLKSGYGQHSFSELIAAEPAHPLLVASLGTPYKGRHYKLIAAVLPLP
jgi:hypothetical protein